MVRARYGTRPLGVSGVALFAAGSLACGLANTLDLLSPARVQALGGAALLVAAHAGLLGRARRGRRFGAGGSPRCSAPPPGPAIGGALTQAFGWLDLPPPCPRRPPRATRPASRCPRGRRAPAAPGAARLARRRGRGRRAPARRALGCAIALALVTGAATAALFLTVLLLISGWGIEPLSWEHSP